jgi:predicted 2-oxoglutarate/Fe(II)-dependent dioxygenase YbiX
MINLEILDQCGFINVEKIEENIFCIPNFLSKDELEIFTNIIDKTSEEDWTKLNNLHPLDWDNKFYDYNNENIAAMARGKFNKLLSLLSGSIIHGLGRILRQRPGDNMNAHIDETYDAFNNLNKDYAAVIYLSDDYEGGELSFVNLNIKVKPSVGSLMIFKTGEKYYHEVKTVIGDKVRYCLPTWILSIPVDKELIV